MHGFFKMIPSREIELVITVKKKKKLLGQNRTITALIVENLTEKIKTHLTYNREKLRQREYDPTRIISLIALKIKFIK